MDMGQQAGFSDQAAITAGGGMPDKLGKALSIGMVRGLVGIVDDNASGNGPAGVVAGLARELIRQDILVLVAGEAAGAMGQAGLLAPSGIEEAGSGLAEFCEHLGISPVLRVDGDLERGRMLAFFAALAAALGVEVAELPVGASISVDMPPQGIAAEGQAMAAGLETIFGEALFVSADPVAAAEALGRRITAKRLALGLNDRFDGSVYS